MLFILDGKQNSVRTYRVNQQVIQVTRAVFSFFSKISEMADFFYSNYNQINFRAKLTFESLCW